VSANECSWQSKKSLIGCQDVFKKEFSAIFLPKQDLHGFHGLLA